MYTFFLEAFGYLGTALVLFSMMMTSLKWLRIFNVMGSVISMIYAALVGTVPVVLLNLGMILINLAQLLREKRKQTAESKEHPETENGSDT
ncbi:MAG: YgjV family protein [Clostridia bacterium]|nr:YgjV family protein [Clostridia bacterium]